MKLQSDTTHLYHWRSGQISQYKRDNTTWMVYSPKTGWRDADLDDEWFDKVASLGYFVERKRDENG